MKIALWFTVGAVLGSAGYLGVQLFAAHYLCHPIVGCLVSVPF